MAGKTTEFTYSATYGNLDNQSKTLYDRLVYENRLLFDQGDIADIYAKVRPNVDENLVNLALDEQRQHALQQKIRYKEIY